jgi:hypothetical protein
MSNQIVTTCSMALLHPGPEAEAAGGMESRPPHQNATLQSPRLQADLAI